MESGRRVLCLLSLGMGIGPAFLMGQPPGHGVPLDTPPRRESDAKSPRDFSGGVSRVHPPLPDQPLYLQCRLDGGGEPMAVEAALRIPSPVTAAELDQVVRLPAPWGPIHVTRYLPRAVLEQRVIPDETGVARPTLEISIDGPTQSFRRWLVADDPERNRLISFIGTWRYMSAPDKKQRDELFEQFKTELTRAPRLLVSRANGSGSREVPVEIGAVQVLDDLECSLRVRSFFPHFAMDRKANKPVNRSDKRANPAVLVEIEHGGQREERWVFAKFPDFQSDKSETLPYRVRLDCPTETQRAVPDFALVRIGRAAHEVWRRHNGKTTSESIALNQRIEVSGSQYTFGLTEIVPSGRLIESYHPAKGKGGIPALRIEVTGASGPRAPLWLVSGKSRVVPTLNGSLVVAFGPRGGGVPGGHR